MKGVILCGGEAKRLGELSKVTNKHLLPIYDLPMCYYPIKTLVDANIEEILIVVSGKFAGHFIGVLKNGKELGIKKLQYAFQEGNGGIADALALAEDFADGDPLAILLGDNCTDSDISKEIANFKSGAHIFVKIVPDPERFGTLVIDSSGNVIGVEEKSKVPLSNKAVTGLYIMDSSVFDKIRNIVPSQRGELEICDVLNQYFTEKNVTISELDGWWADCGLAESLFKAAEYWRNKKLNDTNN